MEEYTVSESPQDVVRKFLSKLYWSRGSFGKHGNIRVPYPTLEEFTKYRKALMELENEQQTEVSPD